MELLTVIAIIGILAALLLPVLNRTKMSAKRAWCESNLQQIGIAFHAFANDHNGKFPMAVSTNDVGSMEYVRSGLTAGGMFYTSFRHFQSLSGELGRPDILICPADTRLPAPSFPKLQNENVSYFVGVDADPGKAFSILAGDRNLATNSLQSPTILQTGAGSWLRWTRELHQFRGNLLFADGHVEEWNNAALASSGSSLPGGDTLFLPSVPPGPNTPVSVASLPGNPNPPTSPRGNPSSVPNNPPVAMTRPMVQPANGQSNRPPGMASGSSNMKFGGTRTAPAGAGNPPAINRTAPAAPVATAVVPAATNSAAPMMSPSEQRLAQVLRSAVEDGYLLLLLLLLLYIAYKMWRRMQQRAAQRRRLQAAQESGLDSGS